MVQGVMDVDAIPALERLVQFAARRHRLIANNIANISTPNFRPLDVSVEAFQAQLGEAVDRRRARQGATSTPLAMESTAEVTVTDRGLTLNPTPVGDNIMFHDGNDRDLDRTMQSLTENFMTFRLASDLLRSRFDLLESAIRERL